MRTERMVMLITPAEKVRIAGEALKLGISASEYVRNAATAVNAADLSALRELEALWPEIDSAIERMHINLDRALNTLEDSERRRAHYDSEAYREEVRTALLNDPGIDWAEARRRFNGGGIAARAAA